MTIPALVELPAGYDADAVAAAAGMVRGFCGWHIAPSVTEDLVLDGPGSTVVALPSLLVTAVAQVTTDGRQVTDFTWSKVGLLQRRVGWSCELSGVVVSLTHGYDECPPEVRAVVLRIANAGLVPEPARKSASAPGGFSIDYDTSAMMRTVDEPSVMAILDRYRIRPRP